MSFVLTDVHVHMERKFAEEEIKTYDELKKHKIKLQLHY